MFRTGKLPVVPFVDHLLALDFEGELLASIVLAEEHLAKSTLSYVMSQLVASELQKDLGFGLTDLSVAVLGFFLIL